MLVYWQPLRVEKVVLIKLKNPSEQTKFNKGKLYHAIAFFSWEVH